MFAASLQNTIWTFEKVHYLKGTINLKKPVAFYKFF